MIVFISLLTLLNLHSPKINIENAWVRPAAKGMNSALYFDLKNTTGKPATLYKVSSSAAELVQIHETINKNGAMSMKEIKTLAVPANKTVQFAPGGYHVMLINLKKDLKAGSKVEFTFYIKKLGEVKVLALVKKG